MNNCTCHCHSDEEKQLAARGIQCKCIKACEHCLPKKCMHCNEPIKEGWHSCIIDKVDIDFIKNEDGKVK